MIPGKTATIASSTKSSSLTLHESGNDNGSRSNEKPFQCERCPSSLQKKIKEKTVFPIIQ